MTAICGVWHPQGGDGAVADLALAMLARLRHRGICEHHLFRDPGATLAQGLPPRQGRITGQVHQQDANGSFAVMDGSILNAPELIHELKAKGHHLPTGDRCEVLLHGYREWGEELVDRLRGPFAFALWDAQLQRLLLCRDRLGIKPLYLYTDRTSERIVFASEIKALFADPAIPRSIDRGRFAEYLIFRSVAGAGTLFEEIRELSPGHLARYCREGMVSRPFGTAEPPPGASGSEVEEGATLLENAVLLHLEKGRKIGTVLSGGLDSSLVSAIAARHFRGPPLETLCAGFEDPRYDERPIARGVARQLGTRHHEIVVKPEEIEAWLEPLTWINDEPLTHPNAVPMYLLCREARERCHLDLLLSGEGADEVFGGYEWYNAALWRQRSRWLGRGIHALAVLPIPKVRTLQRVLEPDYLLFANALNRSGEKGTLLRLTGEALGERRESWDYRLPERDALFRYDQRTYLMPLLQRQDRMSRAAGLDTHVPFLDPFLVDWANRLPAHVKLPRGRRKGLLKQIARRWLPEAIISRPKVGFAMPLGEWMRPGGAFEARIERLQDAGAPMTELIDHGRLDEVIREHGRGADHTDLLWALIAFDTWRTSCVEGSRAPAMLSPSTPGSLSFAVGPGRSD